MTDNKTYYTTEEWHNLTEEERHAVEKKQMWKHLDEFGVEAATGFLGRLEEGLIMGETYWDSPYAADGKSCGCVLGTLTFLTKGEAEASHLPWRDREFQSDQFMTCLPDGSDNPDFSVVEALAYNIELGDTPENNENARLLLEWTREWLDAQSVSA